MAKPVVWSGICHEPYCCYNLGLPQVSGPHGHTYFHRELGGTVVSLPLPSRAAAREITFHANTPPDEIVEIMGLAWLADCLEIRSLLLAEVQHLLLEEESTLDEAYINYARKDAELAPLAEVESPAAASR